METIQKRQVAFKVRIGKVSEGDYVKESGWLPNYILINGKKVSRINVIGICVSANDGGKEFVLEDKSGRIPIRSFEDNDYKVNIGDIVLVVGRPREFNDERYVVPEIVRFADRNWFRLRELELVSLDNAFGTTSESQHLKNDVSTMKLVEGIISSKVKEEVFDKKEKKIQEDIIKSVTDPDDVMRQIKLLDSGDGADYEELLAKLGDGKIIKMLLEEGEIFEIKPGKIKIL
ncbi:MAG: hypothetical protein KAQ83_01035 [Nanoarchaeota archaeon]|nr:hypothetical protein [Nanoarchaeota archaeon]